MQLSIEKLACRRGERVLFEGLSFTAGPGDVILVTGPNGAGKTSLIRLIAGLLQPVSGAITLDGERPTRARDFIHLVGHLDAVKGALTVSDNLVFARALLSGHGGIEGALEALGLSALTALPARVLSAGQRRRLALARLVVAARPLWLLDEPATGLDTDGQKRLGEIVAAHRASGGLVIAATHAALDLPGSCEIRLPQGGGR
jgi:heme exporter protein A